MIECSGWDRTRCLGSPGAPRQSGEALSVRSVPVTGGSRAGRVSHTSALGSLKLQICGTWENTGDVGIGQER